MFESIPVPDVALRLGTQWRRLTDRRRWLRWVPAVACAAAAGLSTQHQYDRARSERLRWGESVTVLVARAPVAAGDTVRSNDVRSVSWPRQLRPPSALADLVPGTIALADLAAGDLLMSSVLSGPAPGGPPHGAATRGPASRVVVVPVPNAVTAFSPGTLVELFELDVAASSGAPAGSGASRSVIGRIESAKPDWISVAISESETRWVLGAAAQDAIGISVIAGPRTAPTAEVAAMADGTG